MQSRGPNQPFWRKLSCLVGVLGRVFLFFPSPPPPPPNTIMQTSGFDALSQFGTPVLHFGALASRTFSFELARHLRLVIWPLSGHLALVMCIVNGEVAAMVLGESQVLGVGTSFGALLFREPSSLFLDAGLSPPCECLYGTMWAPRLSMMYCRRFPTTARQ